MEDQIHELCVMGRRGDDRITWTLRDELAKAHAREQAEAALRAGSRIAVIDPVTKEGEFIDRFDEAALRLVVIPRLEGGAR